MKEFFAYRLRAPLRIDGMLRQTAEVVWLAPAIAQTLVDRGVVDVLNPSKYPPKATATAERL